MNSCKIGRDGEEKAAEWLRKNGFDIVCRNFRRRGFELDIVCVDKKGVLRFIEVKTVSKGCVSDAAFSIERRNMMNYARGVDSFISEHSSFKDRQISMDAIVVGPENILYYENVSCDFIV